MAQPLLSHSLAESVPSAASARQAGAEEKLRLAERVLQQAELRAGLRNQQQWGSSEVFSVPEEVGS